MVTITLDLPVKNGTILLPKEYARGVSARVTVEYPRQATLMTRKERIKLENMPRNAHSLPDGLTYQKNVRSEW